MRYAKPQSVLMQCRRAEVRMRTLKLIGRCQRIHSRDKLSAISVDRFTCRALEPRLWDIFSYVFFRLFVWWFVICVLKNKFIQTHNLHIFPSSSSLIVCQTDILTSSHDSQFWLFGYDFSTYTMVIRTILGTNPFHESLERKKMANGKLIILVTLRLPKNAWNPPQFPLHECGRMCAMCNASPASLHHHRPTVRTSKISNTIL